MSIQTVIVIEPDDDFDAILQSPVRGSGAKARYGSGDALSAELWAPRGTAPLAAGLPVAWLLVDPDTGAPQSGFEQGQSVTGLLAPLVQTLNPTVAYTLKVFRRNAATGRRERIATALIRVRPNGP